MYHAYPGLILAAVGRGRWGCGACAGAGAAGVGCLAFFVVFSVSRLRRRGLAIYVSRLAIILVPLRFYNVILAESGWAVGKSLEWVP